MPCIIPFTQLDYHLLKLGVIDIRLLSGRRVTGKCSDSIQTRCSLNDR